MMMCRQKQIQFALASRIDELILDVFTTLPHNTKSPLHSTKDEFDQAREYAEEKKALQQQEEAIKQAQPKPPKFQKNPHNTEAVNVIKKYPKRAHFLYCEPTLRAKIASLAELAAVVEAAPQHAKSLLSYDDVQAIIASAISIVEQEFKRDERIGMQTWADIADLLDLSNACVVADFITPNKQAILDIFRDAVKRVEQKSYDSADLRPIIIEVAEHTGMTEVLHKKFPAPLVEDKKPKPYDEAKLLAIVDAKFAKERTNDRFHYVSAYKY